MKITLEFTLLFVLHFLSMKNVVLRLILLFFMFIEDLYISKEQTRVFLSENNSEFYRSYSITVTKHQDISLFMIQHYICIAPFQSIIHCVYLDKTSFFSFETTWRV